MTRESLKAYYMQIVPENGEDTLASRWRPDILCEQVDLIFDEFENRTCDNCKWLKSEVCCNDESPLCADFVSDDFGCNKFKNKD